MFASSRVSNGKKRERTQHNTTHNGWLDEDLTCCTSRWVEVVVWPRTYITYSTFRVCVALLHALLCAECCLLSPLSNVIGRRRRMLCPYQNQCVHSTTTQSMLALTNLCIEKCAQAWDGTRWCYIFFSILLLYTRFFVLPSSFFLSISSHKRTIKLKPRYDSPK